MSTISTTPDEPSDGMMAKYLAIAAEGLTPEATYLRFEDVISSYGSDVERRLLADLDKTWEDVPLHVARAHGVV